MLPLFSILTLWTRRTKYTLLFTRGNFFTTDAERVSANYGPLHTERKINALFEYAFISTLTEHLFQFSDPSYS